MENHKKDGINEKLNLLQEPITIYETGNQTILNDSEKSHPILEKLILKSKLDANEGKGISHKEMMKKVKLKYPFLK